MHPRAEEFAAAAAEEHGIDVDVHEFDEGTKTAADAAEAIGCDVAQIASSLVFEVDGEPVVVVTSGANRVDEDRLAAELGGETVAMADPDTVRAATGYSIGGVPPFCHAGDQREPAERRTGEAGERGGEPAVYVDDTLLGFEEVWAAAGTPTAVFPIDPELLVATAEATPLAVA